MMRLWSVSKIASTQCQTGPSDGRRVSTNDFKPETSEISSEIAAEFGFFPVNTKMKAQWACANLPSVKILYYFISLFMFGNLLLLSEEPSQIWNRSKYLWSDHPDGFEENFHGDFTGVSVSIDNDLSQIESKINNFTFKESDTHYYGRRECSS